MKKTSLLIIAAASLLGLAACGGNPVPAASSETKTTSETPTTSETATSEVSNGFSAKVLYPDGTPVKEGDVGVAWYASAWDIVVAYTDANGVATPIDLKEGRDYTIRLDKIPAGYTYNPNAYTANDNNKTTTIQLIEEKGYVTTKADEIMEGNKGWGRYNGRMMTETGCYTTEVSAEGQLAYFGFEPKEPGVYEFESWAPEGLESDSINPVAKMIGTSQAYQFDPKYAIETYDDNGDSKNFKFTLEVSEDDFVHLDQADEDGNPMLERDEDGNLIPGTSWTFVMSATSVEYPVAYTFNITRTGDYEKPAPVEKERVQCTATTVASDPSEDEVFEFCSVDGDEEPVYNAEDGYYHLGSADGAILYVAFTENLPGFDTSFVGAAAQQGTSYYITDGGTKTYEDCFNGYRKLANSDGNAYVTEEVKQMLTAIEYAQTIYSHDGRQGYLGDGAEGYTWLFAVGYYKEKAGLKESNPIFLTNAFEDTIVEKMPAGRTLYFAASAKIACQWEVTCANENISFDYDDENISTNDGVVTIVNNGTERELHRFTITNTSEKTVTAVLQVSYWAGEVNTDPANLIVGTNKIAVSDGCTEATFTATEAGTYYLESEYEGAYVAWEVENIGYQWDSASGTASDKIELEAGDTWTLQVMLSDIYATEGTAIFDIVKEEEASESSNALSLGENVCVVAEGELNEMGKLYTFTAPEAGKYTFHTTDSGCWSSIEAVSGNIDSLFVGNDVTVTCTEGQVVNVYVGFEDWDATSGTVTFTITKA